MIECRGLTRHFESRAVVDGVDLDVARGELLVLIGASGSGKTTLLKMLNRLIEPSAGTVRIDGQDSALPPPHELRRRIGYGAQRAGLLPHLDVAANVGLTPKLLGWAPERIAARVDALLERVQLDPATYRSRDVGRLSGGEQQRVSLARALAAEPPLLLLDEPFGALDPVTRDALQEELRSLREELDLTIVFVTHDMSEALLLGDRIAFLEAGRIAHVGTPAALLQDADSAAIDAFLRAPRRQAQRIEALIGGTEEGA
ncbi:MAG: ATP-binding cassette domain-containing protein [bacterium]|nr:ATP-binding cassette domain-containing protein [bacterium]